MGHYAKVVNNKVEKIIVAKADFFESFIDDSPGEWIKTSYNTKGGIHYDPVSGEPSVDQSKALRKNYAGIGYTYDKEKDAFIPPKPYSSWVLNEQTCCWDPPVEIPLDSKDGVMYLWNEDTQTWDLNSSV